MSFTFTPILGLLMLVGALLFLFSFFIRNKIMKCLLLSFIGLVFFVCTILFFSHENSLKKIEDELVGIYIVDFNASILNGYSSEDFSDLELSIKKDRSFKFNRDVPFLKTESGKWSYYDDGDIWYLNLKFEKSGSIQASFDTNTIFLENLIPEINEKAVKILEFKRK